MSHLNNVYKKRYYEYTNNNKKFKQFPDVFIFYDSSKKLMIPIISVQSIDSDLFYISGKLICCLFYFHIHRNFLFPTFDHSSSWFTVKLQNLIVFYYLRKKVQ